MECLFRYYSYGLEKKFRPDIFKDFQEETMKDYEAGEKTLNTRGEELIITATPNMLLEEKLVTITVHMFDFKHNRRGMLTSELFLVV